MIKQGTKGKKLCAIALALAMGLSVSAAGLAGAGFTANAVEVEQGNKYFADYETLEEKDKAGSELNVEIAQEGAVLLKNNGALPLNVKNITLLGAASYNIVTGGGGSGSGRGTPATLVESLTSAGYALNGMAKNLYSVENGELSQDQLNTLKQTLTLFGDAAVVTLSRTGSEGSDLARSNAEGHADRTEHYLELNDAEKQLMTFACANFEKVVVLINSSHPMELGAFEVNDAVDAVLWIGHTGNSGIMAVGKMLSGEVSPSGRLVDTYAADFKTDPTWNNFGDNSQNGGDNYIQDGEGNYYYQRINGTQTEGDRYAALEYQEGIYLDYKYYETVYADLVESDGQQKADEWYNAWKENCSFSGTEGTGVVYPFGYGLSYTTFSQTLGEVTVSEEGDGLVTVPVTVQNTGDVAGKEVVQVYYSAPYIPGQVEKAHNNLVEFAKTDLLEPGQSQQITITFSLRDMSSFDYNDANGNGEATYELDAGDYIISVNKDAHTVIDSYTYHLGAEKIFGTSEVTGNAIENVFSRDDVFNTTDKLSHSMTREGGLLNSATKSVSDQVYTQEEYENMDMFYHYFPSDDADSPIQDWVVTEEQIPEGWTQAASRTDTSAGRNADGTVKIMLDELVGVDYTRYYDPEGYSTATDGDKKWEEFMNQLTYEEMVTAISQGNDNNTDKLQHIGLPIVYNTDGPAQLQSRPSLIGNDYDGIYWCSEVVIASTWNKELAEKQGVMVGNDSLFNKQTGWWGPAANTHRSPFGGRNFEYYSADGVLGGKIGAAVIKGATSKGVITYVKHFAVNDQETNRNTNRGVATWLTEQALREIYLKPFELIVKEGGSLGLMTGFNRIGYISCAGNYQLLNTVARGEWGFEGIMVTDLYLDCRVPGDICARAGCDTPLWVGFGFDPDNQIHGEWDATARGGNGCVTYEGEVSPTQYFAVRSTAQRVLSTLINSNALRNGYDISGFTDMDLTGTVGVDFNKSISVNAGAEVEKYVLTGGALPEGLTLSTDGVLSGRPVKAGVYNFSVTMSADAFLTETVDISMTVSSAFKYEGNDLSGAALGEEFEGEISSDVLTVGASAPQSGKYTAIEFTMSGGTLPAGMSFEDGIIYGTPEETGTFTFEVTLRGTYEYEHPNRGTQTAVDEVSESFTMVVGEGESVYTVTFNTNGGSAVASQQVAAGQKMTLPAAPAKDGYTFIGWYYDADCTNIADVQNPVDGDITLYAGWAENTAAETEGGCSGNIGGISLGLAAGSLVAIAAVIAVKKRKNEV